MVVLDSSVAGALVLPDEPEPPLLVRSRLFAELVLVPQHWWIEIANVLVVAERRKRLTRSARDNAFASLRDLLARSDGLTSDMAWTETMGLADAHRLTVYDAAYLELALRRGATLASIDTDLVDAARALGVDVLTYTL